MEGIVFFALIGVLGLWFRHIHNMRQERFFQSWLKSIGKFDKWG